MSQCLSRDVQANVENTGWKTQERSGFLVEFIVFQMVVEVVEINERNGPDREHRMRRQLGDRPLGNIDLHNEQLRRTLRVVVL